MVPFCRMDQLPQHRRRSSVNFRGAQNFGPQNMYYLSAKFPNFTWFLPKKLSKYPNYYDICPNNWQNSRILHDFCPKNARISHNNCPKIFFPNFRGGERVPPGTCPPRNVSPPSPMPMFHSYNQGYNPSYHMHQILQFSKTINHKSIVCNNKSFWIYVLQLLLSV